MVKGRAPVVVLTSMLCLLAFLGCSEEDGQEDVQERPTPAAPAVVRVEEPGVLGPEDVALIEACVNDDMAAVRAALGAGADVNAIADFGFTPLRLTRDVQIAQLLVERGAEPNLTGREGQTPLSDAISWKTMDMVEFLLNAGAGVNTPYPNPLQDAVLADRVDVAELLLARGADVNMTVGLVKQTPLHTAAGLRYSVRVEKWVAWLLANGAGESATAKDRGGRMPVHMVAARTGSGKAIQLLIDAGGVPESEFLRSVIAGNMDAVRSMLAADSDVARDLDSYLWSGLHWAAALGNVEMVSALLEVGLSPTQPDSWMMSPLFYACSCRHAGAAEKLLAADPPGDTATESTVASTSHAVAKGNVEILRLLIAHGVDVNCGEPSINYALNDNGAHMLHVAAEWGQIEAAEVLLAQGADVNALDRNEWTPLRHAVARRRANMVEWLLDRGAGPSIPDRHQRQTPLEWMRGLPGWPEYEDQPYRRAIAKMLLAAEEGD